MKPLTDKEKKRLGKALELAVGGDPVLIKHVLESEEALSDKIDYLDSRISSIPVPLKGDPGKPGKDYVLTEENKVEIASKITVPVVERVIIEKTEVRVEQPIIKTEIIKETIEKEPVINEITNTIVQSIEAPEIATKLNTLNEAVEPYVIKGWKEMKFNLSRIPTDFDVRIGVSKTELKRLEDRVVVLESSSSSGGVGAWSIPVETPAADGSVTVFTVGATAPTDVIGDGTMYFEGAGYTFSSGQITFNIGGGGPTQFVRYR